MKAGAVKDVAETPESRRSTRRATCGTTRRRMDTLGTLRAAGRAGAAIFAGCCVERLRPVLRHVPSGAPPLVAGVALTELWRVLEGLQRVDPRRLSELSQACW